MPNDVLTFLLIGLLLLGSGLFSAAEISLLSLGRYRARRMSGSGSWAVIEKLLSRPATTLGGMLVAITAMNYAAEAIAATWVITRAGLPVWTAIVGMAVLVMIFAEAIPISYAAANPERVARAAAVPVWVVSGVMLVPARTVGFMAERLVRLFGGYPRPEEPVTEGEIRALVDLQVETGALEEEEKAMIHHIFEFGDKVAREVMVPRTEVVAVEETATASDAGKVATDHRLSRLPVYRGDLDNLIGLVHVKDVLPLLASGQGEAPVTSVMSRLFRVPETKHLSVLLTDFRRHHRTLAVVVDEYGGTAGLVTLEDLLEEVVGDIYDEYDEVRPEVELIEEGVIALDGRLSVDEASQAIGVALPEGQYDSLAGLLYSHLGVVPEMGQQVELEEVTLVVEMLDGHRIARVRAILGQTPEAEAPAGE